jgi:hypothetical protein
MVTQFQLRPNQVGVVFSQICVSFIIGGKTTVQVFIQFLLSYIFKLEMMLHLVYYGSIAFSPYSIA